MAKTGSPKYGGRGRPWHSDFIKYVDRIANHPTYSGMPDAFPSPGRVQWEAPSNRGSGQFKDTHHKRRQWWQQKAKAIGVDPASTHWISRTAKAIHPFKEKPCKICGRVLKLAYVYPRKALLARMTKAGFKPQMAENDLVTISELISRQHAKYGEAFLGALPGILFTPKSTPPADLGSLKDWLRWIDSDYVPSEPALLSPGAMSNAPDRFDGFHSDNLCCRATADKGRTKANLATYVTDRRVFEHWAAGDWVAADRLMGALRSLEDQRCRHGHPGPCSADHIGPISLGFTHRPSFQALCKSCNSAKNNRMSRSDVNFLLAHEEAGEAVISWHSKALWDLRKYHARTDESALRLSKLLRDNRHGVMAALERIATAGRYAFLITLLELEHADFDVEFENLRFVDHITAFDAMIKTPRITKYATEQKARRCRIALEELTTYFSKENRNSFVVGNGASEDALERCLIALTALDTEALDKKIAKAIKAGGDSFRSLMPELDSLDKVQFEAAKQALTEHTNIVGALLNSLWDDERYVRS